jgi:hypothetical protein
MVSPTMSLDLPIKQFLHFDFFSNPSSMKEKKEKKEKK